jgi:hypothetical protein
MLPEAWATGDSLAQEIASFFEYISNKEAFSLTMKEEGRCVVEVHEGREQEYKDSGLNARWRGRSSKAEKPRADRPICYCALHLKE